jgi:Domain of unknown function (DUF4304)
MQQGLLKTFDEIVAEYFTPFFKNNGFKKRNLNFYQRRDDLYFIVNFQKNRYNSEDYVSFFINCGIQTDKIARDLGEPILAFPREHECLFNTRIDGISLTAAKDFEVTTHTENGKKYLAEAILPHLSIVLAEFAKLNLVEDLLDFCLPRALWPYDDFCRFLSKTGDLARFATFFNHFLIRFEGDERQADLEARLNGYLIEFGHTAMVFRGVGV